jgi:hypothetical protein
VSEIHAKVDEAPLSTKCACGHNYGHHSTRDDHCCKVGCDCAKFSRAVAGGSEREWSDDDESHRTPDEA